MIKKHSKIQWSSLMGEEENEFHVRFQFSLHRKMDYSLLLDEFLKRLQSIKEDGKRIVSIEMEVENIARQDNEVIFDFSINAFFEGECTEEWAHRNIEAALKTSLVPFNWMRLGRR